MVGANLSCFIFEATLELKRISALTNELRAFQVFEMN